VILRDNLEEIEITITMSTLQEINDPQNFYFHVSQILWFHFEDLLLNKHYGFM
jgi:hypothetical protein